MQPLGQRNLLSSLFILKGETKSFVLGFESRHELSFLGFGEACEVLLSYLSFPFGKAPLELCSFALGSNLRLSFSFEELFVIFDLVVELMVK